MIVVKMEDVPTMVILCIRDQKAVAIICLPEGTKNMWIRVTVPDAIKNGKSYSDD